MTGEDGLGQSKKCSNDSTLARDNVDGALKWNGLLLLLW